MSVRSRWPMYLPGPNTIAFLPSPRLAALMRLARSSFSIPSLLPSQSTSGLYNR